MPKTRKARTWKRLWESTGDECLKGAPSERGVGLRAQADAEKMAFKFVHRWAKKGYSVRDIAAVWYGAIGWPVVMATLNRQPPTPTRRKNGTRK